MKLSNKKLFEIREIKGKHIALGLLIFGAIIGLFTLFICFKGTFASEFHGQSHYKPLNEENKGLYGKVNYYLKKALNEGNTNTPITIDNLNTLYPRLRFYCSSDSNNYLISSEEVRLIDFIPDNTEIEEVKFFYNSIFKQLIEKQRKNLSRQYFIIKWTNDKRQIMSIEIDPTLGDVPLLNDRWTGEILLDDPFSKIDPNVVYLIKDNKPLPLFTSDLTINSFINQVTNGYDTIYVNNWNVKQISEYEQMYRNQKDRRPVDVLFRDGLEHIKFLNTGQRIYIQPYNLNVQVYFNGRDTLIKSQTTFLLPNINNNLKIRVLNIENGTYIDQNIYLSKTPFNIASKLSSNEGKRVHINDNYADLFSLQQLVHLESNMKAQQQAKVELSTNIFLSKILENEIKSYVGQLYANSRWNMKDEYQMSVCLMDIATGEIIAAPFYSNLFDRNMKDEITEYRNYNLENHHIGSTFKPLLAFAAAAKYPALSQFRLTNAHFINKDSCSMLGYIVPSYGLNENNEPKGIFWTVGNDLTRTRFLGHSHDNYPIALTMLALTEPSEPNNLNNRDGNAFNILTQQTLNNLQVNNLHNLLGNNGIRIRNYPRRSILFNDKVARNLNVDLGESSFAKLMSNLYNIKTISKDTILLYSDKYVWQLLDEIPVGLSSLFPDIVNLHWDNVNGFIDFENLVLGQGDNKWNNVKLAEAYSRLLSKSKVQATFVKNRTHALNLFANPSELFNFRAPYIERKTVQELNNTWSSFLNDWETAVHQGGDGNTLTPAYNRFRNCFTNQNEFNNYHFYCKTGTPAEEGNTNFNKYLNGRVDNRGNFLPVWYDEGVFVFGITNNNNINPHGIVGVVYIKHISETDPNERNGVESSTARDFLTSDIYRKIMFYNQNRFGR